MDISELSPQLRSLVDAEVKSGERIMWLDQPIPGRIARATIPIVLFAIPWTAFAIFWIAGASGFKRPDFSHGFGFFPLFGIPFLLVGVGMLSSPFWARRAARRCIYVLTDRRAIIIRGSWRGSVSVRSVEAEGLTDLQRKQNADGSGDLIFSQDIRPAGNGGRQLTAVGFLAVRDVKSVEDRVRALVKRYETAA
jgi:hypothetical protein